ncbi:MAG: four helix bundle protein [Candidatus Falkowbacteria bacterium]|nr:four helix bundle protein [Candidatus Parcubacteria bacterium]
MSNNPIKHFVHLNAWQKNHQLVLKIYRLTKKFPKDELYGMVSQTRRAVSSITANIAEGFGRFHYNDKIRFYTIARGSSAEVQNFLIIAKDLSYITEDEFNEIKVISFEGYKLICGLMQSTAKFRNNL